jgi:hypothetical protein
MTKSRQLGEWMQTGNLLALLANINRDKAKRRQPFDEFDFIPKSLATRPKKRQKTAAELFGSLAGIPGSQVETVTEQTSWQQAATAPIG